MNYNVDIHKYRSQKVIIKVIIINKVIITKIIHFNVDLDHYMEVIKQFYSKNNNIEEILKDKFV